jgi:putative SOS response-associated peptidase YedK
MQYRCQALFLVRVEAFGIILIPLTFVFLFVRLLKQEYIKNFALIVKTTEYTKRAKDGCYNLKKMGIIIGKFISGRKSMCGRFSLFESIDVLQEQFDFQYFEDLDPRYNIAPGQDILTVFNNGEDREGVKMRWGLIPFWADDEKIGYKMINARAETVDEKASFKNALKKRRCIIIADGFYEWKKEGADKQPYRFEMKNKKPFALAGLWENWSKNGKNITSCTIITTIPNKVTQLVHDRMPVILPENHIDLWLDRSLEEPNQLKKLLIPYSGDLMDRYQISTSINSAKNEGEELVIPINSL